MTKHEYLSKNLDAVFSLDIKPFRNIDCIEKGLFNYQYFNALAKEARVIGSSYDDHELRHENYEQADYYYRKKDKATLAVLELLKYHNISAYFIIVQSSHLKGKLFEIILNKYDMILHSKSEIILKRLRDENVFLEGIRRSVIDDYINQKY